MIMPEHFGLEHRITYIAVYSYSNDFSLNNWNSAVLLATSANIVKIT